VSLTITQMVLCTKCGRLWRFNKDSPKTPCCKMPPRAIGPGHGSVVWQPVGVNTPPPVGSAQAIAKYLRAVGPVTWEDVEQAQKQGWLVVKQSIWWPYEGGVDA
jgi:hypothetical protein